MITIGTAPIAWLTTDLLVPLPFLSPSQQNGGRFYDFSPKFARSFETEVLPMFPRPLVSALRAIGQSLDTLGTKFQVAPYVEKLQPSIRVVKFGNHVPSINNAFVATSGSVIGRVTIGSNSYVGYGAVLRGDTNDIKIGENVTVGDRVMIHVNSPKHKGVPAIIGNNVTIGAGAIIHGGTLEDNVYIGEGVQVMDGAVVKKNAALGPGSILTSGKVVPERELWSGCPAKFERQLTFADTEKFAEIVEENLKLTELHMKETKKSWQEIEMDKYNWDQVVDRSDYYYQRRSPEELEKMGDLIEGHMAPGRVLNSNISGRGKEENPGKHWV